MIRKANTVSPSGHCLSISQLIVALLLLAPTLPLILLACPCLLTCNLHLPPPVCLLFAPAGCRVAFCCTAFTPHLLNMQPPLNALAGYSNASCHSASAAHPLGVFLPLDALPPSPTPISLLFALVGGHVTSFCTAFANHLLFVLPPLNVPANCSVASCCAACNSSS
jgi:hypothetical protein